ncbi:MAG: biopolymer transporter ExbD [Myxococcales bacterium]|nr:biopolymer transporter ExbD [Myxococcales bacterium]
MAGSANFDDDGINEINIVPLVDIVLVLLIIFMVTAQFLKEKPKELPPGIEVELPAAQTGSALNESLVSIVINKSGELFLNGKPTTTDEIKAYIQSSPKPAKELETLVAADKGISHGDVVRVIDFLRQLGVERFAINTKPQEIE